MSSTPHGDVELLRRSVIGLGEALGVFGRYGPGCAEVRRADAVGAVVEWAGAHNWINAAAVPLDADVLDDGTLPHCLWTTGAVPGDRRAQPDIAMPAMALNLAEHESTGDTSSRVGAAGFGEIGLLNDLAYQQDALGPLLGSFPAELGRGYGIRDSAGQLISAAVALDVGSDTSVQWVVTHPEHRRRGLSAELLGVILRAAKFRGQETASLQSSPAGFSVYARIGFRTVGTLHAFPVH